MTLGISIHVPLAGNVGHDDYRKILWRCISIHVPLAGNVGLRRLITKEGRNFYPRSPCGERPFHPLQHLHLLKYFYPRSPCGERPLHLV